MSAKRPIQPFVPVAPGEGTELYSHRELKALAAADPRNELDELSEPQRFRKDLTKAATAARERFGGRLLLGLLAGACMGALIMALRARRT